MLSKSTTLKFYKRRDIQDAMIVHAQQKEIGVRYDEAFGKRPDILMYPQEILELALKNATSFHASEEIWENPLFLGSNITKKEMDELRVGWDLVLDIDCKIMEYSRIAASVIIRFLEYCGVKDISCKFSGNKGFHIGVPFQAFPKQVGNTLTKNLFPDAPRKIALYIKENIKEELGKKIMEFEKNNFSSIREKVHLPAEDIIRLEKNKAGDSIPALNVDKFLEIDTVLLASRHLYRMPYSLHEKSGLVSLPLDPQKVLEFEKPMARPECVVGSLLPFLDRNVSTESARQLLVQALDFKVKVQEDRELPRKEYEELKIESPIKEDFFPPCMKLMLNGMEDGKKRAVFCLMNFLGKIGWNEKEIEEYLLRWNREKNKEPLRENYIKSQMQHFKAGERLPPNCDNDAYYKPLGVHCNAEHCHRVKNPVNYTLSKWKRHLREKEEQEEGKGRRKKKGEETMDASVQQ